MSWMKEALQEAEKALRQGLVPVGAVVVYDGSVIARAHNGPKPYEHAEWIALQAAYDLLGYDITKAQLYVTLEPCFMCAGMIQHLHVPFVYFGAYQPKEGGYEHGPMKPLAQVFGGFEEEACGQLMRQYFRERR